MLRSQIDKFPFRRTCYDVLKFWNLLTSSEPRIIESFYTGYLPRKTKKWFLDQPRFHFNLVFTKTPIIAVVSLFHNWSELEHITALELLNINPTGYFNINVNIWSKFENTWDLDDSLACSQGQGIWMEGMIYYPSLLRRDLLCYLSMNGNYPRKSGLSVFMNAISRVLYR